MLKDLKLQIVYKPINSILGYVNNTRVHPQEQIDQIKSSIIEFGMCTPVGIHNDTIVYGHGRHEALKQLGYDEVPTLDLSHLTEAQRKAFTIADNKIALNAGWDEELLKIELQSLQEMDFDINLLGFDIEELENMDIDLEDDLIIDTDKADEVPEIEENPVIKVGDLIELNNHRLLCGDSTDIQTVTYLMNGEKADICFTDPDYAMANDHWIDCILEVGLKNGRPFFIMASDQQHARYVKKIPNFRKFFAGIRTQPLMISQYVPMNKLTIVSYFGEKPSDYFNNLRDQFTDVFEFERKASKNEETEGHRHYKNIEVPKRFLSHYAKEKSKVIDLFGGSGSTLIASDILGMDSYICELQPTYVQLIIQRYVDYSINPKIKINNKDVNWEEYKTNFNNM